MGNTEAAEDRTSHTEATVDGLSDWDCDSWAGDDSASVEGGAQNLLALFACADAGMAGAENQLEEV
jgi:hypothetical protein